jgi:hypothetical protein
MFCCIVKGHLTLTSAAGSQASAVTACAFPSPHTNTSHTHLSITLFQSALPQLADSLLNTLTHIFHDSPTGTPCPSSAVSVCLNPSPSSPRSCYSPVPLITRPHPPLLSFPSHHHNHHHQQHQPDLSAFYLCLSVCVEWMWCVFVNCCYSLCPSTTCCSHRCCCLLILLLESRISSPSLFLLLQQTSSPLFAASSSTLCSVLVWCSKNLCC